MLGWVFYLMVFNKSNKMTEKEKEAEVAFFILGSLLFIVPMIALDVYFLYEAFDFHPLMGLWFAAINFAAINWLIKQVKAKQSKPEQDEQS